MVVGAFTLTVCNVLNKADAYPNPQRSIRQDPAGFGDFVPVPKDFFNREVRSSQVRPDEPRDKTAHVHWILTR